MGRERERERWADRDEQKRTWTDKNMLLLIDVQAAWVMFLACLFSKEQWWVRMGNLLVWAKPPGWPWHWYGYLKGNDLHQDGKVTGVSTTTRMALTLVWLPWMERSASGWQSNWCEHNHQDGTDTDVVTLKGTICIRMAKLLVWLHRHSTSPSPLSSSSLSEFTTSQP